MKFSRFWTLTLLKIDTPRFATMLLKSFLASTSNCNEKGKSTLWWYISGKKMYWFFSTFCIILRVFFISFNILKNTKNGFLTQIFPHNSCYIPNDSVFSKSIYVFTHLRLFEWKTSSKFFLWNHMSGILHIELKWDIELIYNIWLSTSSSLVIIWMVLKIHLRFVVYWYDYNFFINIFFNHLISISKWDFFLQSYSLGFELPYSKHYL
jgi:hypothetical protein